MSNKDNSEWLKPRKSRVISQEAMEKFKEYYQRGMAHIANSLANDNDVDDSTNDVDNVISDINITEITNMSIIDTDENEVLLNYEL